MKLRPLKILSAIGESRIVIREFDGLIEQEKKLNLVDKINLCTLMLGFTAEDKRNSEFNIIYEDFYVHLFEREIDEGKNGYLECMNSLSKMAMANDQTEFSVEYIHTELDPRKLNKLLSRFINKDDSIKLTVLKNCMVAVIATDNYTYDVFNQIKFLTGLLKISDESLKSLIPAIMKVGSLNIKDLSDISEIDKLFIFYFTIKDLYENDSGFDLFEKEMVHKIEDFLGITDSVKITSDNYISRSFFLNDFYKDLHLNDDDAVKILKLAIDALAIDGTSDSREVLMIKEMKVWLKIDQIEDASPKIRSLPEKLSILDISDNGRIYGLLLILKMVLADNKVEDVEARMLDQMAKQMRQAPVLSNDDDLMCFMEILVMFPQWTKKYHDFIKKYVVFFTNHIQTKEELIRRFSAIYYLCNRRSSIRGFDKEYVVSLGRIFGFDKEQRDVIFSILEIGGYQDHISLDTQLYKLISANFVLKTLVDKISEFNIEKIEEDIKKYLEDTEYSVKFNKHHIDTYKFLFSWL